MHSLLIGLMSGTSLDGVDGVLAELASPETPVQVLQHISQPFDAMLKAQLLALNQAGDNELHRAALAGNALAGVYASVVRSLLKAGGVEPRDVSAIGVHGQTVRHRPHEFDGVGYTLQINSPALLAEMTGICVVCDFRSRDVAAGGQGAPLVPAFHRVMFAAPTHDVAVVNVGVIANLSVLGADGSTVGFDCGPGNALIDHWCELHMGQPFDAEGAWAARGCVDAALLTSLLQEPYFHLAPPKSTGRDLFNAGWLNSRLARFASLAAVDVQATLVELTALAIAQAFQRYAAASKTLILCGGGALNAHLVGRIAALLPGISVASSGAYGLPPLQVEAAAFAWLASETLAGHAIELAAVTGARGNRVLGAVYPA